MRCRNDKTGADLAVRVCLYIRGVCECVFVGARSGFDVFLCGCR